MKHRIINTIKILGLKNSLFLDDLNMSINTFRHKMLDKDRHFTDDEIEKLRSILYELGVQLKKL